MSMNRTFVIIDGNNNGIDINDNINAIGKLFDRIILYTRYPERFGDCSGVEIVKIDDSIDMNYGSRIINSVLKDIHQRGIPGFLHIIQDDVKINNDPTQFINDVENMMTVTGNISWLNCSCDPVNYVFSKFNPRFKILVDDEEALKRYSKTLVMCSNANISWMVFNMDKYDATRMFFNESFSVPMFYIIEFLARRRNIKSPGEFYYMNMYPTVESELGVFGNIAVERPKRDEEEEKKVMIQEDQIFKQMNVDYHPDHDIVSITEDLRNILISK